MKRWCILVVVVLLVGIGQALAQDERPLNPNAVPARGIAAGGVGFQPDPFRVEAMSIGGEVNAQSRNLAADCTGLISVEPNFRFSALTPFERLRFIFIADTVTSDASLVILDPKGDFYCNNNFAGLRNPMVEIANAPEGDYNIWVGALTARVFGDLYVTTRGDVSPGSTGLVVPVQTAVPTPPPTPTPIPPTALNPTLYPEFGADGIAAGFLPDPYYRVVSGGGALDVTRSVTGDDCVGYVPSAPTFRVEWSGVSTRLNIMFAPLDSEHDTALVVQDPSGGWTCNRDFAPGYSKPQVQYINPSVGTYNVWVSDEVMPNEQVIGVLYVSEKQFSPETVPAIGTVPSDPIGGLIAGTSAFEFTTSAPDPYAVPGSLGGGEVNIGAQYKNCPGAYTTYPSFGFILPDPTAYLRVFFVSDDPDGDASLIVLMPDGTWYCADDSLRSKQPIVDIIGNFSTGGVSVWVGSFEPGEMVPGTLYITRGSASPADPTRPAPVNVRG